MNKQGFVYILASDYNGTLYIGATTNLLKRIHEHKSGVVKGFSQQYSTHRLVYYQIFDDFKEAFAKEKQMKSWNRS
ncbi:MAG: GIY-YIG nuclease family protein [Gammaproteobacteria bacterium]|nr:GIY-YIG nuclease family protein [Gammaproteobacteria bacterium]